MERVALFAGVAPSALGQLTPVRLPAPDVDTRVGEPNGPAGTSAPATQLSAFARLWQQKDAAIAWLQAATESMDRLRRGQDIVAAMRREIEALVKNYPPFPPGSEERLQYLRSISALRQQLDALTVPPRIEAAPVVPKLPQQPPDMATDAEWQAHAEALDAYQAQLAKLGASAADALQSARMWPEVGKVTPDSATVPDRAHLQALAASLQQSTASLSQAGELGHIGL